MIQPERSTIDELKRLGFSRRIIDSFFRPFLGGVFLEDDLVTSHRMFEFVFAMLVEGYAALPAEGMQAIPRQMSKLFPRDSLRLKTPVKAVMADGVELHAGNRLDADAVVVATEAPAARVLLNDSFTATCNGVSCLYYVAERPPIEEPIVVLNGDLEGPINNLCVPSQVVSSYAPPNRSLISVTVLNGQRDLETVVLRQLHDWFGDQVDEWLFLRRYDIPYALPSMVPPDADPIVHPPLHVSGVFLCGDHCDTSSLNGAMASGRRAAEAMKATFEGSPA
jgi:phytoene dehydrogenase-like protein